MYGGYRKPNCKKLKSNKQCATRKNCLWTGQDCILVPSKPALRRAAHSRRAQRITRTYRLAGEPPGRGRPKKEPVQRCVKVGRRGGCYVKSKSGEIRLATKAELVRMGKAQKRAGPPMPNKALRDRCKKLGIKLTRKQGNKRVYKSEALLKKQCIKKKRVIKKKKAAAAQKKKKVVRKKKNVVRSGTRSGMRKKRVIKRKKPVKRRKVGKTKRRVVKKKPAIVKMVGGRYYPYY